jgi:predicted MFS family arabinose efflux permease
MLGGAGGTVMKWVVDRFVDWSERLPGWGKLLLFPAFALLMLAYSLISLPVFLLFVLPYLLIFGNKQVKESCRQVHSRRSS